MQILKQSTAVDVLIGPFVDSTDGYTAETGVSPAVKLSKNGQALAAKNDATTPVHDADGYYNCELDATDTDTVGTLVLTVVGSATSLPVRHEYTVVEENVYDMIYASGGDLGTTIDAILTDTAEIGSAGAGLTEAGGTGDQLTAVPWNSSWDTEVQSEVNDGLVALGLDHLLSASVTGTDVTDNSIIAKLVSSSATADWDTFVNTTDSLQATRDHVGDGTNLTEAGGTGDQLTAVPWNTAWATPVNDEVVDALATDTYAEPGQGAPGATVSLSTKISYIYKAWRNQSTQTSSQYTLYADDASTVDQKAAVSDDGTTFTRGEVATGP